MPEKLAHIQLREAAEAATDYIQALEQGLLVAVSVEPKH